MLIQVWQQYNSLLKNIFQCEQWRARQAVYLPCNQSDEMKITIKENENFTILIQWTFATITAFVPKEVAIKMNLLL